MSSCVNIKGGFLIKGNKIFDTQIMEYELNKKVSGVNIIYYMTPRSYKRLYLFEPLLFEFDINKVFEILMFNTNLKEEREKIRSKKNSKTHYMSNFSTIYNYPAVYLTQRKFSLYKICQQLKKKLV